LHWRLFALGLICLTITNLLDVVGPWLIGQALDELIKKAPFEQVSRTVGILLIVTTLLAGFRFLWRFFWSQFHHNVAEDLRNRLFAKFTELGPAFFSRRPTGELMSLINNDVNVFRMAIGPGVLILFDALTLLIFIPFLMFKIAPDWVWKCLILMPLVPFTMRWMMKRSEKAFHDQQNRFADMSGAAQEIVSAVRVIKSYAQEANQTKLFNRFSKRYQLASDEMARVDSLYSPVLTLAATFGSVVLLAIGAPPVIQGTVSIGLFFAFYQYVQRMVWPMEALGEFFHLYQMGKAAYRRIQQQLETETDTPDLGQENPNTFQSLEVRNLTFTYPGDTRPTLKNINFKLGVGEILGIVGPTGAGKSTLAHSLTRLYPIPPHSVLVNGKSIEQYSKESYRKLLAFAPQDTFLFSRKLSENLAMGKETWDQSELEQIARIVDLDKEISLMPEQYNTVVGERGINLSGGQRQRIAIARALIRNSPLVILDDSLSAVDAKTESLILTTLKNVLRQRKQGAAIIISHRLQSLMWADKILVMSDGLIEALGSHDELLRISPTYQKLHALQHGEEQKVTEVLS